MQLVQAQVLQKQATGARRCSWRDGLLTQTPHLTGLASQFGKRKNNNKYRTHSHMHTHGETRCAANCLAYFTASIGNWQPLNFVSRHHFCSTCHWQDAWHAGRQATGNGRRSGVAVEWSGYPSHEPWALRLAPGAYLAADNLASVFVVAGGISTFFFIFGRNWHVAAGRI